MVGSGATLSLIARGERCVGVSFRGGVRCCSFFGCCGKRLLEALADAMRDD